MNKKILAIILSMSMLAVMMPSYAFAVDPGVSRVTIGANLSDEQVVQIYADFGVERGAVTELKVTNDEEREYLEGLVPDGKIGRVALSCVYIITQEDGTGITVSTNKINWCTSEMYINALTTAGIRNAKVKVSAPYDVSGTAALTGIYKAYEDITGEKLPQLNKQVGAEELVTTGELADIIGSEEATQIINELKKILDETKNMTDVELKQEIRSIADAYNVTIDESMIDKIVELCRKLEQLDADQLRQGILDLADTVNKVNKASLNVSEFFKKIGDFFASIGNFFVKLFGGK